MCLLRGCVSVPVESTKAVLTGEVVTTKQVLLTRQVISRGWPNCSVKE